MRFDEILRDHLGQFGRYQILQYLLFGIPIIFAALHPLSWTFTGAKMDHRCLYPGENSSAEVMPNDFWHQHLLNITNYDRKCERISNLSLNDPITDNLKPEPCLDGYAWDRLLMSETAVSRWSIVCDRTIIRAIIQSMYFVGQLVGSMILGVMSDHFGRKPVFVFSIVFQACCGIAFALVPHWGLVALLRFCVGFGHPGIFIMAVVIGTELVGPKYRLVSSLSTGVFWAFGVMIMGALSYPLRDYKYLQLAISVPELLFVCCWWLTPESPRWLMSRNRFEDADGILSRVAKCNGRQSLPANWYKNIEKEKESLNWKQGLYSLVQTPSLRKRTLVSFILWPVVTMTYYGLAVNPSFMGGDDRLGFIVGGALELPGLFVVLFTLNTLGRKFLTSFAFILAGVCLFLTLVVPDEVQVISLLLVLIGKGALTSVFALVYIMTPEHYPTPVRNTAVGACSTAARAGGIAASFMSMYVADTHPEAVAITFGVLAVIAGIATLFLPETTGAPLLETVEEAEAFGNDQPFFMFGFQSQRMYAQKKTKDEMAMEKVH